MKTRRFWIVTSLSLALNVLAVIGAVAIVARKGGLPWLHRQLPEVLRPSQGELTRGEYPNTALSVYGQLPVGPDDLILLGDEVLGCGEWHELLGNPHAKNRAITGDDTGALLRRLRPISDGGPRHVVLSCGSNNLQRRVPYAQTVLEYGQIVTMLGSRSRGTDIWLLPVLPVNARLYRRWIVPDFPYLQLPRRRDVEALNGALRALAAGRARVHFVDLPELVDQAGELRQEYTLDGLHLNGEGLRQIATRLRQVLPRDSGAVAAPAATEMARLPKPPR